MSLKNCPFCGGVAEIEEWQGGSSRTNYLVECANAGGDCPMAVCSGSYDNRDEAITAWNTRAAPTMKPWVWKDAEPRYGSSVTMFCNSFMIINDDRDGWLACLNGENGSCIRLDNKNGHDYWHDSKEDAQVACVAYVEGKLKEWLVS